MPFRGVHFLILSSGISFFNYFYIFNEVSRLKMLSKLHNIRIYNILKEINFRSFDPALIYKGTSYMGNIGNYQDCKEKCNH